MVSISTLELAPSHNINYIHPNNFKESDIELFYDNNFINTIPSVEMNTLINVNVSNKFIFIKQKLIFEFTCHSKPSIRVYSKSLFKKYFKPNQFIDQAILGIQEWDDNYFHWITETLPSIILVYHKTQSPVLLNTNSLKVKHIVNSLKMLRIPFVVHDIFNKTGLVQTLYAVKVPRVAFYNEFMLKNMKNHIATNLKLSTNSTPNRNIYISRSKANRRGVLNEKDLVLLLNEFGFESICLEDYNLEEQIKILSEAKIVVASHGAGLTNVIFMNKQTTVIELKARNNDYWCFFSLAKLNEQEYYYLLCDSDQDNHRNANISIDLLKLKELLAGLK